MSEDNHEAKEAAKGPPTVVREYALKEGFSLTRLSNGDVRIDRKDHVTGRTDTIQVDSTTWCCAITAMSKGGEDGNRINAGLAFHDSEGEIEVVAD